jgi:hypothetical protein
MELRRLVVFAAGIAVTSCGGSEDENAATAVEQRVCEIACACDTPCEIVYERWYSYGNEAPELRPSALDPTVDKCEATLVKTRRDGDPVRFELFDTTACLAALDRAECMNVEWTGGPALTIPLDCYSRAKP